MTIDDIRKLSAWERAALPPGVAGTVLSLCDAVDALIAVVDALPRCNGDLVSGSGGHTIYSHDCNEPATTWDPDSCVDNDYQCDRHLEMVHEAHHKFRVDLPYADALRAMLAKDSAR